MRLTSMPCLHLAATVMLLGCAASSGGGGPEPATYKQSLGTAALGDVETKVPKVLNQHQYQIERQDGSPSLLTIQSRWNGRYPLEDEIARGVTEAMTRLIITARARARAGGTADVRVLDLVAENRVLMADSAQWTEAFMTPMFREYLDKLVAELKTELLTGIRVY